MFDKVYILVYPNRQIGIQKYSKENPKKKKETKNMKKLMYKLKKILTREHINHFEIDYMKDDPYFLQIRLCNEDIETGNRIADCIMNANTQGKIHEVLMVYKPGKKTIEYGYSGIPFTAIDLEILLEKTVPLKHDFILLDDDDDHII